MKGKYLITTDKSFKAPDGKEYNAVWGEVEETADNIIGMHSPNYKFTIVKVGSESNHVLIAGLQIHFAVKTSIKPIKNDILIME